MDPGEWIALGGFIVSLGAGIFSMGVAFGRIRAVAEAQQATDEHVADLRRWKEEVRVDLERNFVRRADLDRAVEQGIAPVRILAERTHELVAAIAERMHVPATARERDGGGF